MLDILGWMCFSNAPFLRVKRVFFCRPILWTMGALLALGMPLAWLGTVSDNSALLLVGFSLALPFLLWVALLGAVSLVLAAPRLLVFGLVLVGAYLGFGRLSKRIVDWGARYQNAPTRSATDKV